MIVHRLRWFDREPGCQPTPVDWRSAAPIIATVFLNIHFWFYDSDIGLACGILPFALLVAATSVLITVLFFLAPALTTHSMTAPLARAIENSLGSVPAFGLRLCCISFLVLWMADYIALLVVRFAPFVMRRDVSSTESFVLAASMVAFVLITGVQSTRTTARLAAFTNKLAIALLIAAMIRVREELPAAVHGSQRVCDSLAEFRRTPSFLAFSVAPIGFMAGGIGHRVKSVRQLLMTAAAGFTLPLFGIFLVIGVIRVAVWHSRYYQPSLNPNVLMALWGGAASSALPGRMLIVAITLFGALRFAMRTMAESVDPIAWAGGRIPWVRLSGLCLAVAWLSVHPGTGPEPALEILPACLVSAAAVVSVDCLTGSRRLKTVRKVDWLGVSAMAAGLACAYFWCPLTGSESWSYPWVLPSYFACFLVCFLGRFVQRFSSGLWN